MTTTGLPATPTRRIAPPPRWRPSGTVAGTTLAVLALLIFCGVKTEISVPALVQGWHGMVDFVQQAFPPDLSWTETVQPALQALVVTFAIGLMGTVLALPFSLVLAVLGSRTTTAGPFWYQTARTIMSTLRAVPDVVFALVFVTAVGLGPFAGVLAIVVHGTGVQAKLWSEAMDETDPDALAALRSTGARRTQVLLHAVLPDVAASFVGLVLYRLDVNVRTSLVLGLVGAGGIGFLIDQSIQLFRFDQMVTQLALVLVLIVAVDVLSSRLRKRLHD